MLNFFSLKDKIIFITGGSGNLGTDFTKTLLDAKAKIVVLDINDSEKIKVSENLKYFNLDITKKEEIKEVLEIVKKEWGIPFGLIENFTVRSLVPFVNTKLSDLPKEIAVLVVSCRVRRS